MRHNLRLFDQRREGEKYVEIPVRSYSSVAVKAQKQSYVVTSRKHV
jgi:hypothetical protein